MPITIGNLLLSREYKYINTYSVTISRLGFELNTLFLILRLISSLNEFYNPSHIQLGLEYHI